MSQLPPESPQSSPSSQPGQPGQPQQQPALQEPLQPFLGHNGAGPGPDITFNNEVGEREKTLWSSALCRYRASLNKQSQYPGPGTKKEKIQGDDKKN